MSRSSFIVSYNESSLGRVFFEVSKGPSISSASKRPHFCRSYFLKQKARVSPAAAVCECVNEAGNDPTDGSLPKPSSPKCVLLEILDADPFLNFVSGYVAVRSLVKAFDTVPREALFAILLRRFGLPDHFVNIVIRLHENALINV